MTSGQGSGDRKASNQRIVVTGYGVVSAFGVGADALRTGLRSEASGLRTITRFDASDYPTRFAAETPDFDPGTYLDRKQARRMDRFAQFAMVAAREAVSASGFDVSSAPDRTGVVLGSAFGGLETFGNAVNTMLTSGPRRVSPFAVPMTISNMAPGLIAIDLGATGPAFSYASAFASGAHAIGEAARMIQQGRADVMLAGGSEAPIIGILLAGFAAMKSMSENNDHPELAVRPFDLHRDGCALGEGAAMLLLERQDRAIARGATILAELAGYGATADAFHEVQLAPDGDGIARAMQLALDDAKLLPANIEYLNAHGTATAMNDAYETTAIKTVFGAAAHTLPISSTKSRTGHMLGAAGAVEAAICIQALTDGFLPGTRNLTSPDPECDLDYLAESAHQHPLKAVMSNSMGFGGHNVALILTTS